MGMNKAKVTIKKLRLRMEQDCRQARRLPIHGMASGSAWPYKIFLIGSQRSEIGEQRQPPSREATACQGGQRALGTTRPGGDKNLFCDDQLSAVSFQHERPRKLSSTLRLFLQTSARKSQVRR